MGLEPEDNIVNNILLMGPEKLSHVVHAQGLMVGMRPNSATLLVAGADGLRGLGEYCALVGLARGVRQCIAGGSILILAGLNFLARDLLLRAQFGSVLPCFQLLALAIPEWYLTGTRVFPDPPSSFPPAGWYCASTASRSPSACHVDCYSLIYGGSRVDGLLIE